jgi:hypothetical protein
MTKTMVYFHIIICIIGVLFASVPGRLPGLVFGPITIESLHDLVRGAVTGCSVIASSGRFPRFTKSKYVALGHAVIVGGVCLAEFASWDLSCTSRISELCCWCWCWLRAPFSGPKAVQAAARLWACGSVITGCSPRDIASRSRISHQATK